MVTGFDLLGRDSNLQNHWVRRFAAYFIDVVIVALIIWFLFNFLLGIHGWIESGLVVGIVMILYSAVLEATANKTLGKALLGLHVTAKDNLMDFSKALVRNLSKFLWFIFPLLDWIIGMVSEGDPRQRYLDRVAGTTVVSTSGMSPGYQWKPAAPTAAGAKAEKCIYCGAPLTEIGEARFQCTSCGIIQ